MGMGAWREREQTEKGQRPGKEFSSDFPLRVAQRERADIERTKTWEGIFYKFSTIINGYKLLLLLLLFYSIQIKGYKLPSSRRLSANNLA